MLMRLENDQDHDAVRQVNQLAFGQKAEARLVDALRAGGFAPVSSPRIPSFVSISPNSSATTWACSNVLSIKANVISDADASMIAQPTPSKLTSLMTPAATSRYTLQRSPHRGSFPSPMAVAISKRP